MSEYLLIKLLHVIGFAYWLGGDLGVFYSSYFVADDKRPDAVRVATAKILFALDQAPRICMTMSLPLGTHLAWRMGALPLNATSMTIIWILCFGWLAMVITLHLAAQSIKSVSLRLVSQSIKSMSLHLVSQSINLCPCTWSHKV